MEIERHTVAAAGVVEMFVCCRKILSVMCCALSAFLEVPLGAYGDLALRLIDNLPSGCRWASFFVKCFRCGMFDRRLGGQRLCYTGWLDGVLAAHVVASCTALRVAQSN